MHRTHLLRRKPLAKLLVGFAGALIAAAAVEASPPTANLIGVYSFASTAAVNDLAGTASTNGISGRGELLLASDGYFYAVQSGGGANGAGAVMRVSADGAAVVVHAFKGDSTEAILPYAGLIQASDGRLYGTSYAGGTKSLGTIYRLGLDGTYTTLYSFLKDSNGGYRPYGGLVQGPDGALYGTTLQGGTNNTGTLFRLTLDGTYTQLLSFTGATNGANPEGPLVVGTDGLLYGTTMTGGANDRGTIFKVTTSGTYTLLYSFEIIDKFNTNGDGINDKGANPRAGLRLGPDGNFYGTAYQGGANGYGTVFRVTPSGTVTLLHTFAGIPTDGSHPLAPVTVMPDGTLYGTTSDGGTGNGGTAWRRTPGGTWSLLHSFSGSAQSAAASPLAAVDGTSLYAGLVPLNGYLYGLTYSDHIGVAGTVYKLDLGSAGTLPVTFSVSPEAITLGSSAVITWSSPTAATCSASELWSDTISTSGTVTVTPTSAGIYNYAIACTDGAGVTRYTRTALKVTAPPAATVDAGASVGGGGSLGLLSLLLLGGAAGVAARRRRQSVFHQ
ncbi:MAG: hypothetical protein RLZZ200_1000 [Pseudomonadota bacterium]|jgi:uncharacterized repeat protein (TIGR03803 family)